MNSNTAVTNIMRRSEIIERANTDGMAVLVITAPTFHHNSYGFKVFGEDERCYPVVAFVEDLLCGPLDKEARELNWFYQGGQGDPSWLYCEFLWQNDPRDLPLVRALVQNICSATRLAGCELVVLDETVDDRED